MWRRPLASYVTNYVMYVHGFPDVFDARDVLRIEREDAYVERFFMHMYDLPGSQVRFRSFTVIPWLDQGDIPVLFPPGKMRSV